MIDTNRESHIKGLDLGERNVYNTNLVIRIQKLFERRKARFPFWKPSFFILLAHRTHRTLSTYYSSKKDTGQLKEGQKSRKTISIVYCVNNKCQDLPHLEM